MSPAHCYFCGQIAGRPDRDLIAALLPDEKYQRRVMLESEHFAVIPSLGPLTPGHSLLCSKTHAASFAALAPALQAELSQVKRELRQRLRAMYGGVAVIFEHGMAGEGTRIPCTVDHAHMHFVPLAVSLEPELLRLLPWRVFDGSLAALARETRGEEYLLLESDDGACRVATRGAQGFESQFMRRAIAAQVGSAEAWNWRDAPNALATHAAWRRFVDPVTPA